MANQRRMWMVLIISCCFIAACEAPESATETPPATLEKISGTAVNRVTLTQDAAQRIDLHTVLAGPQSVPYAAVIYDPQGQAWVYTRTAPLTFVRTPISITRIAGDTVWIANALPANTKVVTLGATELYGIEYQGSIQP